MTIIKAGLEDSDYVNHCLNKDDNVEVPGSNPGRDTICCRKCWEREHARKALQVEGVIINPVGMPMIVCSICGNKRCPHATDHNLSCTGRNDTGQVGSIYY